MQEVVEENSCIQMNTHHCPRNSYGTYAQIILTARSFTDEIQVRATNLGKLSFRCHALHLGVHLLLFMHKDSPTSLSN